MENHFCLNCDREIFENYCPNCGQKSSVHRYSLKHFIEHDLIHGLWHVDNGIFFTIKELFTRPGNSIREFINGKRVGYFSFVTLLLLILGFSHFLGEYSQVKIAELMPESSRETMNQLEEFMSRHPKSTLFMTIPFYSIFSFLWFRKSKLNLTEHFVLNSYKTIGESLIILLFTIMTVFYNNLGVLTVIYGLVSLLTYVYAFSYYQHFFSVYGYSKKSLILRSLAVIISYMMLFMIAGILIGAMKYLT